ncbi:MAG: ATPase, T2SS/T4P/T4SS family [Candidatus Aenigmatarchaeota archaeon]
MDKEEIRLDEYEVSVDFLKAKVEIKKRKEEYIPTYYLKVYGLKKGTEILVQEVKESLIPEIPVKEYTDLESFEKVKAELFKKAKEKFREIDKTLSEKELNYLANVVIIEMLGIGILEFLLNDPNLEEIVVNNAKECVKVYHRKFGWLNTNIFLKSENEIQNISSIIARRSGRQINILNPLLDTQLHTGDRVNATLYPISSHGNTITIRKFRRVPWTIIDFIKSNTLSFEIASFLWQAVQYELNIIVVGGTASGKTSLLNVILTFIPPNQRIISIEDSVSGEEEILLKENGKIRRVKIEDIFKGRVEDEIIPENVEVLSINKFGKVEFKKVKKFIRHKVKKPLYKIVLASGKTIKVTGDHSLFSLDENLNIIPIKVSELKKNSYIVTPRYLELPESVDKIDLIELFRNSKNIFVKGESIRKFLESSEGRKFLIKEIPTKLRSKRRNYRIKGSLPVYLFEKIKDKIEKKNLFVYKQGSNILLPSELEIDENFAFILGCWVGDGCYDKTSVIISMSEKEVLEKIESFCKKYNLKLKKHSDNFSYVINCSLLKELMIKLGFDGDSYTKRIPEIVFSFKKNLKAEFLKGIFSAEGWVSKHEVRLVTYSENLKKDIETLLLNFGIVCRTSELIDKAGKKYFDIRISGNFLKSFAENIGFAQIKKQERLNKILKRKLKSVTDIIPLSVKNLKELKYVFRNSINPTFWKNWHRRYLKSSITREYLKILIEKNLNKLLSLKNPLDGKKLLNLIYNDIFWDKVKEIEKIDYEGYVYDLSVEENENFICNNILAHNTRELNLPNFMHWVSLVTRPPNPEGKGEVKMLDLLVNSLRMRPDRIVVGEIRRAEEAEVLFEAMHTGHSVYATFHAETAEQAYKRFTHPPINVPETLMESLHLFAVMFRERRRGIRRLLEISEIVPFIQSHVNALYKWDAKSDSFIRANESMKIKYDLEMFTGLTQKEIEEDLKEKQEILKWLIENNFNGIENLGKIFAEYYFNKDEILDAVKKKRSPFEFI